MICESDNMHSDTQSPLVRERPSGAPKQARGPAAPGNSALSMQRKFELAQSS